MKRKQFGFSLVEMAVVLIIFGLVLASASSILTLFVNKGGAERTRKMIESNKNALYSIGAADGYITATPTDDRGGANAPLTNWAYPNDAYNVPFHFVYASELAYTDVTDELDYSPVCGASATTLKVRLCSIANAGQGNNCATYTEIDNVAFVVVSGSVNKNIQTDVETIGTDQVVEVFIQGDDAEDDFTTDVNRPEKYDDIVDWATLPELRVKAGCDPDRLRLLDSAMPVIRDGEFYNFTVRAIGGIPFRQSATFDTVSEYTYTLVDDNGLDALGIDFFRSAGRTSGCYNRRKQCSG